MDSPIQLARKCFHALTNLGISQSDRQESKTEVPRDVRNSKSGNKTSSGEIGLNIRTLASPSETGPVVWRSKRSASLQMLYGNLSQFGKKSISVIRSRSVTGSKNWCNA